MKRRTKKKKKEKENLSQAVVESFENYSPVFPELKWQLDELKDQFGAAQLGEGRRREKTKREEKRGGGRWEPKWVTLWCTACWKRDTTKSLRPSTGAEHRFTFTCSFACLLFLIFFHFFFLGSFFCANVFLQSFISPWLWGAAMFYAWVRYAS